jgi:glycolate oxidase FAD binding subunit
MSTTTNIAARLESVLGSTRVIQQDEELREYAVDGLMPGAIVRPANSGEVVELVRFASREGLGLIASGSRSKMNLGMPPVRYDIAVDMRGMQEIAHYDAGDLTLSVDAGMPLRVLERVLSQEHQFLPLAVPCYETSTVGGAVASGIDSLLRQHYGSARDFLIGAEFVDGKGNLCKSGGRVVKNVSGYDLHKLLVGSVGTLAIITRLNFRTFPSPQAFAGFVSSFADADKALAYQSLLQAKGLPLANVELLNPEAVTLVRQLLGKSNQTLPLESDSSHWHVYASYEGSEVLVERIYRELQIIAREAKAIQGSALSTNAEAHLSGVLREAFDWLRWAAPNVALFRISIPHFAAKDIIGLQRIASDANLRCALLIRATSTFYFTVLAEQEHLSSIDALSHVAEKLFAKVNEAQGSAVLLHAPQTLKQRINIWGARRDDFFLMERVKHAFDLNSIFSPGRFVGGL